MLLKSVPSAAWLIPEYDGVMFINVYSRAETELGRYLSHFQNSPFQLEDLGAFKSVEGLWQWLKYRDDSFRVISGPASKALADSYKNRGVTPELLPETERFKAKILEATRHKLNGMPPALRLQLIGSRLPLVHFYHSHVNGYTDHTKSMEFVFKYINSLRANGKL